MTDYEQTKQAVNTIKPAIENLDEDLLTHVMTIVLDRWASDRHMSCNKKCELVAGIYHNFVELKNNV